MGILEGAGDESMLEARCRTIRDAIDRSDSEYEADKLKERLAKLGGGVAVIKVGGASEVEVNEVKDRLNDALLYASRKLEKMSLGVFDQQVGAEAVGKALLQPCMQIANNAGHEGAVIVQYILKRNGQTRGFDASTGEYVDMIKAGIIDPTKVVRAALADAVSVASLMTTTEAIIADVAEDDDE
eukprot:NODE_3816_length_740_cov_236.756204.p1 GENE.NODE_3816_length_740_cov_236.756204~~NODE_3816_length_740_cov_236.756204.p1  ORF type:complete len:184 (-),score=93.07 NODE_3816_length_740_cov_236.756204:171-722(-)